MSEENKRIRLLYVDDEENNLSAFKANFRRDYDIFTAISAAEGLKILEQEFVHIIICDQRMPGMTGVEFFESILESYPDPVRVLLTGYADIEAVIDSINRGEVYRFINKPWDLFEIKNAIDNAYDKYVTNKLLQEKIEELKKANSELSNFVYSVSHDLRAPLMSIMGIIQLAKLSLAEQKTIEYFMMIEKSVQKLDNFIRNVIDYRKNNSALTEIEDIDMSSLLKDIVEKHRFMESSSEVDFHIQVNQKSPFYTNEVRTRIILNNLISNAIKYQKKNNDEKWIKIDAEVDSEKATIIIQDNGIGIDDEHLESIFKMFYRATDEGSGSGMGLYIVREAISKLNGEISLTSKFGEGCTFTCVIPNLMTNLV